MQAIRTHYLPATLRKPARIVARASGGRVIVSRDVGDDEDIEAAHARAALTLYKKLGWSGPMKGGTLADGSMAWVFDRGTDHTPTIGGWTPREAK